MPPKTSSSSLPETTWLAYQPGTSGGKVRVNRSAVRSAVAKANHAKRRAARTSHARNIDSLPRLQNAPIIPQPRPTSTERLLKNVTISGEASRTILWTRIMLHTDLHSMALFLTSTEVNLPGIDGQAGANQPCTLILYGQALRCMKMSSQILAKGKVREMYSSFDMCLSILGAWEKVYGTETSIHRQALHRIFDLQLDEDCQDRQIDLLNSVKHAVRTRFDALSDHITYDGEFNVPWHLDTMATRKRRRVIENPNYALFSVDRPEVKSLFLLLNRLAEYDLASKNAWVTMHELSLLVFAWRCSRKPPSDWSVLTSREHLEDLTLYHIRAGMVAVLLAWTAGIGLAKQDDGYFRASETGDEHYREMLKLLTEPLFDSDFDEAAFWSLFTITAAATPKFWRPESLEKLRSLLTSPRIAVRSFEDLEALLRKYAYREAIHRQISLNLYTAVTTGAEPDDQVCLRNLKLTPMDLAA